jgi:hypothetical protein
LDNKILAIIGGMSVIVAGLIISAPPVRSVLKTPALRTVGAGLLAAGFVTLGVLVERFVLHAN